jgi:hypothetical protein
MKYSCNHAKQTRGILRDESNESHTNLKERRDILSRRRRRRRHGVLLRTKRKQVVVEVTMLCETETTVLSLSCRVNEVKKSDIMMGDPKGSFRSAGA